MFVVKKQAKRLNVKKRKKGEKTMSKENVTNVPGIIGQMYEDRKSKKRGVLESREEKYKTLMFRAEDGSSFNMTYATFRSNWRKYQGEEVIQTSTQVEEQRKEEEKKEESNKQIVETKSEVDKPKTVTTQEKVKKTRAVEELVSSKISKFDVPHVQTAKTGRGCVIVRYKKKSLFEIWTKFNIDKYDLCVLDDVAKIDGDKFNSIKEQSEYNYKEKWNLSHLLRIKNDDFDNVVDTLLELAIEFAKKKNEAEVKKEEK